MSEGEIIVEETVERHDLAHPAPHGLNGIKKDEQDRLLIGGLNSYHELNLAYTETCRKAYEVGMYFSRLEQLLPKGTLETHVQNCVPPDVDLKFAKVTNCIKFFREIGSEENLEAYILTGGSVNKYLSEKRDERRLERQSNPKKKKRAKKRKAKREQTKKQIEEGHHPLATMAPDEPCPNCKCIYWVPTEKGDFYNCEKCGHVLGEPVGDKDESTNVQPVVEEAPEPVVAEVEALPRVYATLQQLEQEVEELQLHKQCVNAFSFIRRILDTSLNGKETNEEV